MGLAVFDFVNQVDIVTYHYIFYKKFLDESRHGE